jgi:hypothetical protein
MMTKKDDKKDLDLDVCTQTDAEQARPNEPGQDTCDDGRSGTDTDKKKHQET